MNLDIYLYGLYAMLSFALAGWLVSLYRKNVTHVDSMWSLFFVLAGFVYAIKAGVFSDRSMIVLVLVTVWAVRLCAYLTWRNWGPHEDHRYAEIRRNNAPYFSIKSLYIVFGLQSILAWIVSLPILAAVTSSEPIRIIDVVGISIVGFGLVWETLADWQLSLFKADPKNKDKVLESGVWRYSRHPNYFGEFAIWWGFFLIALATGAFWALFSPLLMTFLLLKFSGVALLEKDIGNRRPAYAAYIKCTNAFFPGPRKTVK
jgi:steroid 5-alpha reductase family enzyme